MDASAAALEKLVQPHFHAASSAGSASCSTARMANSLKAGAATLPPPCKVPFPPPPPPARAAARGGGPPARPAVAEHRAGAGELHRSEEHALPEGQVGALHVLVLAKPVHQPRILAGEAAPGALPEAEPAQALPQPPRSEPLRDLRGSDVAREAQDLAHAEDPVG